ncbi:MAG TPA: glycosyltransferase family 2 protein [bacterium]|nr:glycosyltransferase family 2 protein [bacterium]
MKISIVVPCYNEQEVLRETCRRIKDVLASNGLTDHEILFINDGSTDSTPLLLCEFAERDRTIKVIHFSRNFGHEAATAAGIRHCSGDIAFLLDADLQDPPELIPEMIALWQHERCNVVYGVRKSREGETFLKKLTSKLFYRFFNAISDVPFPIDTGDFRLIDHKVISEFKRFSERKMYVRGLLTWVGFRQMPFFYERHRRFAGTTKYNYRKLLRLSLDIIFSFTKRPLKLALELGAASVIVSLLLVLYAFVSRYVSPLPGWASTVIIIIFFGGVQLLTVGVIGEYIAIIFDEVKRRPQYIVDELLNLDTPVDKDQPNRR